MRESLGIAAIFLVVVIWLLYCDWKHKREIQRMMDQHLNRNKGAEKIQP